MFAVPVAVVGALGSLALTHQTLNLFSLIGSVLLIGLVTKNGILLVDFANMRRRDGLDRTAAIREAARERFRPIMMTTVAMIAGMTPVALQLFRGEMFRSSMSIAVTGGLITSTALTLVIVPAVFTLVDDIERWVGPRVSKLLMSNEPRSPATAKVPPHAVS
jgi:HAE1 family hydrophobic/amphiphilic exporter-1